MARNSDIGPAVERPMACNSPACSFMQYPPALVSDIGAAVERPFDLDSDIGEAVERPLAIVRDIGEAVERPSALVSIIAPVFVCKYIQNRTPRQNFTPKTARI